MKTRTRVLRRGLFKRTTTEVDFETASAEELAAFFEGQKYGSERVDENLAIMANAARRTLRDAGLPENTSSHNGLEGNPALAAEVLTHLHMLEGHRRHQRLDDAIHEAMMAVQRWMELRMNVLFERRLREREKQLASLPHQPTVSNEQIRAALSESSAAHAAQILGITDRQIRNRIPVSERRTLAAVRKRKSARVPPRRGK